MKKTDYLIIGAGIASLNLAYNLKDLGNITIVSKTYLKQTDSYWDYEALPAVNTLDDRFKKHINDTMQASENYANRDSVRHLVEGAPKVIKFLEDLGLKFNKRPERANDHSEDRMWKTSDNTSQDIFNILLKNVQKCKNIEILENTNTIDLISDNKEVYGAYIKNKNEKIAILSKYTILANGGLGQLYEKTSNPRSSSGDGLSLAIRAGAELKDLEFIQFYPTSLNKIDNYRYLNLPEIWRNMGARIVNSEGESFLKQYHEKSSLAPNNVLNRAITFELYNKSVYLDLRSLNLKDLKLKFPNFIKRLKKYSIDPSKNLLPICPVSNFSCGGVAVNIYGETNIHYLLAVGEVACTSAHGANALTGNPLLESLVFPRILANNLKNKKINGKDPLINENLKVNIPSLPLEDLNQVKAYARRISHIMWEYVSIIRRPDGLRKALKEIREIPARDYRIQNRQMIAYKIIEACINRQDSLGCHYITDELN